MSSMFECTIEGISGATVRIRVQVVHPDEWDVSGEKNFALQTIVDVFWRAKMGYLITQPAEKNAHLKQAKESPVKDELEHLLELSHGRKETISEAEYNSLNDGGNTLGISSWGSDGEFYYKQYSTDYNEFCKSADRIIKGVELVAELNNPKEKEDDPYPSATLVIILNEEKYAKHMVEGMHWDTAIYDFDYYRTVWYDPAYFDWSKPCPDFNICATTYDPFDGAREEGTPDRSAFSEDGVLLLSSQMGEVVALKNETELWRIKPEIMFGELSIRNGIVVVYDVYESKYFSLSDGSLMEMKPKKTGRSASSSGKFEVTYGENESLDFFDGRVIPAPGIVEACAFSMDESMVSIGGMFNEIIIADPETGNTISTIKTGARCGTLSFSPDGQLLAVGVDGTFIEIYEVANGKRLTRTGGKHYLTSAQWSPDGTSLVVAHVTDPNGYDGYFVSYPVIAVP